MEQEVAQELASADLLVKENIDFALRIARKFFQKRSGIGIDVEDYEGAALVGLCSAAERFNPSSGTSFQTFSYFRICGSMYDLVRQSGLIPRQYYDEVLGKRKKLGELENSSDGEREAAQFVVANTATELANLTDMLDAIGIKIFPGSDSETTGISYSEDYNPEQMLSDKSTRLFLQRVVNKLPEDERQLIELKYFFGYSVKEIGKVFGRASKGWVSRLHAKAMRSLRRLLEAEDLQCAERVCKYSA